MPDTRIALAGLCVLPLLAGCNTIEGVGKDVQTVGRGVTSAATYVERELFEPEPSSRQANIAYRSANVTVGPPCDADSDVSGGTSSLPACRSRISRPSPRNY